ncbi:MAG: methionyl-tRNA formyltransferase [Ignavibacteriaceae bacterium]
MRIVFLGTPDFAIPSLKILIESRHEVAAVVTAPDKERGRGRKISYTAVKEFSLKNNLPVLQPDKLKDQDFIDELKKLNSDVFVVVAFRILPKEVFTIPSKLSFNLHASLLPKFRGAAPIQWALIKGESRTGVTTFALEEKVDTGNVIIQEEIGIDPRDNFGSLHDKLSELGAEAVMHTVDIIEKGKIEFEKQNNALATPAPKITKEIAKIDWNNSAEEIHNLIRGLSPYPGAYFEFNNKIIKVYKSEIIEKLQGKSLSAGEIYSDKSELLVGCGKNLLSLLELQQEGKNKLSVEEFLRGFRF